MVDPDPFVTLPMPSRSPVEPSDFLLRLAEAMRASDRTIAWLTGRPSTASLADDRSSSRR